MKLKLLWTRHAESLSNVNIDQFNIHPFLSYKGLLQSIDFGEKISKTILNKVYSSMSLRTILTSMISISIYNLNNIKKIDKIIILPFISEINPFIEYLKKYEQNKYIKKVNKIITEKYNLQNYIFEYRNIIILIKISIDWINENWLNFIIKDKILDILKEKNVNQKILEKIKKTNDNNILKKLINEILKIYKLENYNELLKLINFKINEDILDFSFIINNNIHKYNFYDKNEIYNFLFNNEIPNKNIKTILLYSHSYYIKNLIPYKKNKLINNCDIFEENIELEKNNNKIEKKIIEYILNEFNMINIKNVLKNEIINNSIQNKINSIINK
jgi:hypothetical protein